MILWLHFKGTGEPYNHASVYSPPPVWTAPQRHALANSLLVEYTNTFDLWYADPTPAGDGGPMKIPGGIITNIDSVVQMTDSSYSTAGSWNDADMLQMCTYGEGATRHWNSTGKPNNMHGTGLTLREYAAHLSVWSILGSPLIHSADLRTVKERHPDCLALMVNTEILAVNQDAAVLAPRLLYASTNVTGKNYTEVNSTAIVAQAWTRPLSAGKHAVVLFNRGDDEGGGGTALTFTWAELGLAPGASMSVRDVVKKEDLGASRGPSWSATVPPHGVMFVVLTPEAPALHQPISAA